jgi:hypothetical protein
MLTRSFLLKIKDKEENRYQWSFNVNLKRTLLFVSGEQGQLRRRLQIILVVLRSQKLRFEQNLSHLKKMKKTVITSS